MDTIQLKVNLDLETHQLLEAAAVAKSIALKAYIYVALRQALARDGLIDADQADRVPHSVFRADLLQELEELRAAFDNIPKGEPMDVSLLIELVRAEREAEIFGFLD